MQILNQKNQCLRLFLNSARCPQLGVKSRDGPRRSSSKVAASSLPPEYSTKLEGLKVLVAGATGGTGREIVKLLGQQGVPVRAMVRDTTKADKLLEPGANLEVVVGDVFQFSTLPKCLGDANAIIVATGAVDRVNPLGPFNVDFQGTLNLIALARQRKVKKIVLITSIGTDELINFLNLFWGVLFWKKRAEEELQRSGIDFTIVRPGGLKSELRQGEKEGAIVMERAGFFGVPPARPPAVTAGSILRSQVAEVCVASLAEEGASYKVVEVIAKTDASKKSFEELFAGVE